MRAGTSLRGPGSAPSLDAKSLWCPVLAEIRETETAPLPPRRAAGSGRCGSGAGGAGKEPGEEGSSKR